MQLSGCSELTMCVMVLQVHVSRWDGKLGLGARVLRVLRDGASRKGSNRVFSGE